MRRSDRETRRDSLNAQRAARAESARIRALEVAKKEAFISSVLARKEKPLASPLDLFETTIEKKAPRLLQHPTYRPVIDTLRLRDRDFVRPIRDWKPHGKGCETLFRSLCEHLWAKYPMPAFLWSGFFENFYDLVIDVARGGSLFTYSKEGRFPVPMTRAMVHDLLTKTPGDVSFTRAVRRIQVKAVGGAPRFWQVWTSVRPGQMLGQKEDEAFWATVIEWFAKNPMLDLNQVGPIVDFLTFKRNQNRDFSMKGRTPMALMRGMEEWHGELAKVKATHGAVYMPSGFRSFEWERASRDKTGNFGRTTWRIQEILTSKDLIAEGRDMKHCVGSYSWSIEAKRVSIWSLSKETPVNGLEKVCTIEVINGTRSIVQARGKYNKMIESESFQIMQKWAGENGLVINLGRW